MEKSENDLFPFQVTGSNWLATKIHALLADDMGLGKSAQAIKACDLIGAKRIGVICPASVRVNWKREFEKFSTIPRRITVLTSGKQQPQDWDCLICSFDMTESFRDQFKNLDLLIVDESHFLKTLDTKRTRAILAKNGVIHGALRTWFLSGTPAPNHAGELWPILFTTRQTNLAYDDFVERYCTGYNYNGAFRITGTRGYRTEELKRMLSGFMLRRKKEEVMPELPPISFRTIVVEPGEVDLDIAASFVDWIFPTDRRKELFEKIDGQRVLIDAALSNIKGIKTQGATELASVEALAPSISTLRRYTGLQKVKAVGDLVADELSNNAYEKIVIFALHRDVIEQLRDRLKKFKPVTLYGGTAPEKRQQNVDKFQKNPKCRVFIGNILAAGTGITLTAAHNVLFVEQDWVPGNNAQAAMRCHRIGQDKPVLVRFCGLVDSFDERVAEVLRRKTKQLADIFDT